MNADSGVGGSGSIFKRNPFQRWTRSFRQRFGGSPREERISNTQRPDGGVGIREQQVVPGTLLTHDNWFPSTVVSDNQRNGWEEEVEATEQFDNSNESLLGVRQTEDQEDGQGNQEALIGDETRDILSYNNLLEQARAIIDIPIPIESEANRDQRTDLELELETTSGEGDRQWFFQTYGKKRITEVPRDEIIFELQYLRKSNRRETLTDREVEYALRALLLTEPTIVTPVELFKHCNLLTDYDYSDSEYESATTSVSEEGEIERILENPTVCEPSDHSLAAAVNIVSTQVLPDLNSITVAQPSVGTNPLADCTKLTDNTRSVHLTCKPISHLPILTSPSAASTAQSKPNFIAATIPQVGYSQPTMNFGTSPLTSTPFNKPSVQSRRVSFNPGTTSTQITNPQGARPKTQLVAVKPDISISMYAKELSRLLASGMDYDKASNAADSIVRQVMANTTTSPSSYLASNIPSTVHGSTPPIVPGSLGLTANTRTQSIPQSPAYNSQIKHYIPGLPSAAPQKTNLTFPINQSNSFDKKQKLQQSQAMTLFSNVGIYIDRERSGRFDDWMAHLESVLVLGDFEESRKVVLLRSKLYGEAADEFDNFKLENPIRAQSYTSIKERLHKLFHSTETRSKQSVEFHNMQREPEENMRRYANRIRKAFSLAYPLTSILDKATSHSREQIMMDRFLEGLSFDVQTRLKYKEFGSFEKLIEKAEMTAMAVEEAQVRNRLNAFQSRNEEPNRDLDKIADALERLNTKVESNTFKNDLEKRIEKMQAQLSAQKSISFSQKIPQVYIPPERTGNLYYCDFHNSWGTHKAGNCKTRENQVNLTCHRCKANGHIATFCPQIRNSKPPPPPGYDGNGIRQPCPEQKEN